MPIGTMTTRAIVPRTVSIVSLAWKALRRQCRRATALVSVQGCQREVHSSAISTKIHIRVAVTIYLPGRSNTAGRNKWSAGMPLARYILCVGGALLSLLFISDAYLPKMPVSDWGNSRSAIIHIHSDQKWPERIVYDTSLPTVVPAQRANIEANVAAPEMPPLPQSGRHLHNCNRQASYPMPKSENRSCNANAKLQRNAPPRLHSLQRGKCNLAGLATACGERLDGSYRPFETMSLTLSIGHAGCG